jgi:hypothetical protein
MDQKYERVRVVPVERVTLVSARPFDEVGAGIYSGLGRPDDFAALVQRWASTDSAESFDALVAESAGSAGLIEFLSLDLGEALAKHPGTVADAGSYAPVTILVAERPEGVHIAYDRVASAIAPYESPAASAAAVDLDRKVLQLLRTAAGPDGR